MITAIKIMLSTAIAAVVPAKMFVLQFCLLPSSGVMLGVEVGSTVCRRVLVVLTAIAAVVPVKLFVLQSWWLPSPGVMLGVEVGSTVCRRVLVTVNDGSMLLVG